MIRSQEKGALRRVRPGGQAPRLGDCEGPVLGGGGEKSANHWRPSQVVSLRWDPHADHKKLGGHEGRRGGKESGASRIHRTTCRKSTIEKRFGGGGAGHYNTVSKRSIPLRDWRNRASFNWYSPRLEGETAREGDRDRRFTSPPRPEERTQLLFALGLRTGLQGTRGRASYPRKRSEVPQNVGGIYRGPGDHHPIR